MSLRPSRPSIRHEPLGPARKQIAPQSMNCSPQPAALGACKQHNRQSHSNGPCSANILPRRSPLLRPTHLPSLQAYEQRERQRAADRRRGAEILDEQLAERERERIKQEELRQLVGPPYRVLTLAGTAAA